MLDSWQGHTLETKMEAETSLWSSPTPLPDVQILKRNALLHTDCLTLPFSTYLLISTPARITESEDWVQNAWEPRHLWTLLETLLVEWGELCIYLIEKARIKQKFMRKAKIMLSKYQVTNKYYSDSFSCNGLKIRLFYKSSNFHRYFLNKVMFLFMIRCIWIQISSYHMKVYL